MIITTTGLTRAAGLCAVAGGLIYVAVQVGHPHLNAAFAATPGYAVREGAKIVMVVLSLVGITGIYLSQVRRAGVLGLVGFVVLALGYLAILGVQLVGVFVLPHLATLEPGYVDDVLAVATSGTPSHDVGAVRNLINGGAAYIVGGTIFGIALVRAGVLARWAAVLLAVGALATAATPQLPELVQRLFAVPVGVALVGLGLSLWRQQRTTPARRSEAVGPALSTTGVR